MSLTCQHPSKPESGKNAGFRFERKAVLGGGTARPFVRASASGQQGSDASDSRSRGSDAGDAVLSSSPFPEAVREGAESQASSKPEVGAPKVLVVDDEQTVRRVCTFALKGEGWRAESDGSPAQALARMRSGEHFDALVLDFAMPEMDGLEFLRRMRSLPAAVQPAVLLASAHADGAVALESFRLGVWDLLSKPLLPDDLRRRVRRLLGRHDDAARGDLRARSLLLASQCRWSDARNALAPDGAPLDQLLRGLYFQLDGEMTKSRECFSRAHWWDNWDQQGSEIWAELSRRLDKGD